MDQLDQIVQEDQSTQSVQSRILITSSLSQKGIKITSFLENRGFRVFGVDYFEDKVKNKATTFFRLDLRHRETMELLLKISKPEIIVYIWESSSQDPFIPDTHYLTYWRLLHHMVTDNTKKMILLIDEKTKFPRTAHAVSQMGMWYLSEVFMVKYGLDINIITNEDNLFKKIKENLSMEGGEVNE